MLNSINFLNCVGMFSSNLGKGISMEGTWAHLMINGNGGFLKNDKMAISLKISQKSKQ